MTFKLSWRSSKEEKPDSFHGVDLRAVDGPYYPEAAFPNQARISIRPTAPAWGAEVVSSNVVGYYKLNLANGYTQIGVQLQNVGDDAGTIGLNDLSFNGLTGYDWDAGTPGDSITIWDSASQSYAATYYWTATDPFELGIGSNVWFDESALAKANVTIPVGGSIFVFSKNGGTATFTAP